MGTFKNSALALCCLLPASCGGLSLEVGGDGGSSGGDSGGTGGSTGNTGGKLGRDTSIPDTSAASFVPAVDAPSPPSLPSSSGCPNDEESAHYVGSWAGVVPQSDFAAATPVRLEIAGASREGGVCGTLTFGDVAPPPPAQDPNASYPGENARNPREPFPGFPYTVVSGEPSENTLSIGTVWKELYVSWCELQAPIFDSNGGVHPRCVELDGGSYDARTGACTFANYPSVYTFDKCGMCMRSDACRCNAGGCGVNAEEVTRWSFALGEEDGEPTLTLQTDKPFVLTKLETQ